jgi:hypothetical protein
MRPDSDLGGVCTGCICRYEWAISYIQLRILDISLGMYTILWSCGAVIAFIVTYLSIRISWNILAAYCKALVLGYYCYYHYYYQIKFNVRMKPLGYGRLRLTSSFSSLVGLWLIRSTFWCQPRYPTRLKDLNTGVQQSLYRNPRQRVRLHEMQTSVDFSDARFFEFSTSITEYSSP